MPRVPTYDNFQVAPAGGQVTPVRANLDPQAATIKTRQLEALGAGAQKAGVDFGRLYVAMQEEANTTLVRDGLNQLSQSVLDLTYGSPGGEGAAAQEGYLTLRGAAALRRPGGEPLPVEYTAQLRARAEAIAAGLGNDAQRQAFEDRATPEIQRFEQGLLAYVVQEQRSYAVSVAEGTRLTSLNRAAVNYANPDVRDAALADGLAAIQTQAAVQGQSQEWVEAQNQAFTSGVYATNIEAALQAGDLAAARAMLTDHKGAMTAQDVLRANGDITTAENTATATAVGNRMGLVVANTLNPTEADLSFNILLQQESGRRQFNSDGSVVTSSAGAIGIAQVMPATGPEAARLAGVEWDEARFRNDAAYNERLGRAYFEEQLRRNEGDLAKAYAAYNGGPGRLQEAITRAQEEGGTWLEYMPQETQNYVTANMSRFNAGGGRQSISLAQVRNLALEAGAEERGLSSIDELTPDLRSRILAQADKQFADMQRMVTEQFEAAKQRVYEALPAAGYNINEIDPALWRDLRPEDRASLRNWAEGEREGQDGYTAPETTQRLADDAALLRFGEAGLRDLLIAGDLSRSDYDGYVTRLQNARDQAEGTNVPSDMVKRAAQGISLVPWVGSWNEEQAQLYAQFDAEIQSRAQAEARASGPLTRSRMQEIIDRAVSETVEVNGWWGDTSLPAFMLTEDQMEQAQVDIEVESSTGMMTETIPLRSIPSAFSNYVQLRAAQNNRPAPTWADIAWLWVQEGRPSTREWARRESEGGAE